MGGYFVCDFLIALNVNETEPGEHGVAVQVAEECLEIKTFPGFLGELKDFLNIFRQCY